MKVVTYIDFVTLLVVSFFVQSHFCSSNHYWTLVGFKNSIIYQNTDSCFCLSYTNLWQFVIHSWTNLLRFKNSDSWIVQCRRFNILLYYLIRSVKNSSLHQIELKTQVVGVFTPIQLLLNIEVILIKLKFNKHVADTEKTVNKKFNVVSVHIDKFHG